MIVDNCIHLCVVEFGTAFKLLVEYRLMAVKCKEWRDRPDSNRGLPTPQAGALSRLDYGPNQRGTSFNL
jgi:hypothetical protein